ncbi:hypothetical protein JO972_03970 [Verrucomicrobiaceae bacterium 5K15]|uniref:Uncharacterized protein n=1 Tax=Oceaniferula flava TaxID=2800421 RepID=A0AAE2V8U8_9BACT|nr:hypothetical protein [Oceaniferula flavus]MBK1854098.1 hypothetical protein [Oceaniferula flavus]MBM1135404.1 hypothetical protein [Oceaniferula flavus]
MPLASIFKNEFRLQLRRPYVWFCFINFFLLGLLDTMQTGLQSQGHSWINGAAMICNRGIIYSLLGTVAIAGIILEPFVRDRLHGTKELILTTPTSRFIRGPVRFFIAWIIVTLATLLLIPGMILGAMMPGIPDAAVGPVVISHYLKTVGWFLLPNYFLVSVLIYWVGNRFENRSICFGTASAALALWVTTRLMLGIDIFQEDTFSLYALLDPFGSIATFEFTREQTVAQSNIHFIPFASLVLYNRLIWVGLGILIFVGGSLEVPTRLRYRQKTGKVAKVRAPSKVEVSLSVKQPSLFAQFWQDLRWNLCLMYRQPSTRITVVFVMFTLWWSASSAVTVQYSLPTTDLLIHNTNYYFDKILILAVFWLAGSLVWRDRSLKVDEIINTQPTHSFTSYHSKTVTLLLVVIFFWCVSIGVNILYQLSHGYHRLELGLYFIDSFIFKAPYYLWFGLLAIALQVVIRSRYLALAAVFSIALSSVLLDAMGIRHPMFHFAHVSHVWYSLMDGYGHFWEAHWWMLAYWSLGSVSIWLIGLGVYRRGSVIPPRWDSFWRTFRGLYALALPCTVAAFLLVGCFIHHLSVDKGNWPPVDEDQVKANIELEYGADWRNQLQPRITGIEAVLDLFPHERRYQMHGTYTLENPGDTPIAQVLILSASGLVIEDIRFAQGATQVETRPELNAQIWKLNEPLQAGQNTTVAFTTSRTPPAGISIHTDTDSVPDVAPNEMIENGTAMLNLELMPVIGYTDRVEHKPAWQRKKYGLPQKWSAPSGQDSLAQGHGTLHLSWVRKHRMTIRTAADQTALYGGTLKRRWKEPNGRNAFLYEMTGKSRGWSAVVSGKYERRIFKKMGLPDVEIYFNPQHIASVDTFGTELQAAIEHFTQRYGPTPFDTFRLAENSLHYDGFGSRGGLAYCSEILGWKADLKKGGTEAIRRYAALMVALSWWGDQIIPANIKGAKVIHSGLPYWTAALYLHHQRSSLSDHTIRRQEMMEMFRVRGEMVDHEVPFITEFKDSTIIRKKGSTLILYLAEQLGAERLDRILAQWLARCRYQAAPYPTAAGLYNHLKNHTPTTLHPFLSDFFEHITIWRTSIEAVTCQKTPNGQWKLRFKVQAEKSYTSGWGDEHPAPFQTKIQIAAFRDHTIEKNAEIHSEWILPQAKTQWIEWTLNERPKQIGCDPYLLLPDPNPQDNTMRVK